MSAVVTWPHPSSLRIFRVFLPWTFVTFKAFAASVGATDSSQFPNLGTPCRVSSGEIRSSDPYPSAVHIPLPPSIRSLFAEKRNKTHKVSIVRIILSKQISMVTQCLTNRWNLITRPNIMRWPIGLEQHTVARMWRLYKTGIGLTTGFIRSQSITQLGYSVLHFTLAVHYSTCRVVLQLQLTLTTESLQGPGPPADPTGSHWPSTNSSGLFSATHRQLTRYWNCPIMAVDVRAI
jgi:hypothetical protein